MDKKHKISAPSGATSERANFFNAVGRLAELRVFPPTSGAPPKYVKWSAHALLWEWALDGTPKRAPTKTNPMRGGWLQRVWEADGITIISYTRKLQVWITARKRKNAERMIFEAWNKADLAAREFSRWQEVGLKPLNSERPAGLQSAHLVIENPELQAPLNKHAFRPESARAGLIFDGSHGYKPELTGKESAEAGLGFDYLTLNFPLEWRERLQIDAERWRELEGAVGLLRAENARLAEGQAIIIKALLRR